MKLDQLIHPKAIVPALAATDRDGVIRELVHAAAAAGVVGEGATDTLVSEIIARETKGSTGFGKNVAVPHTKRPEVPELVAALGLSKTGIDFKALDRQPVYIVVLVLSPEGQSKAHIAAMDVIFTNLQHDRFRNALRQAGSTEDIQKVLATAQERS